jgi:crossover junction endodeoxyribonuclease RusA
MSRYAFTVPGKPVPKGRPRVFRNGGVATPKATVAFEHLVRLTAKVARIPKLTGRVALECRFFMPDARRKDGDNLLKAVADSLNGVAYDDDSQVVEWHGYVAVDRTQPRTMVVLTDLEAREVEDREVPDSSPHWSPKGKG